MTPLETNNLRLEVKQIIARLDLDRGRKRTILIEALKRRGMAVSRETLCMALTGYRATPPYAAILASLKEILTTGEFIHGSEAKNN